MGAWVLVVRGRMRHHGKSRCRPRDWCMTIRGQVIPCLSRPRTSRPGMCSWSRFPWIANRRSTNTGFCPRQFNRPTDPDGYVKFPRPFVPGSRFHQCPRCAIDPARGLGIYRGTNGTNTAFLAGSPRQRSQLQLPVRTAPDSARRSHPGRSCGTQPAQQRCCQRSIQILRFSEPRAWTPVTVPPASRLGIDQYRLPAVLRKGYDTAKPTTRRRDPRLRGGKKCP